VNEYWWHLWQTQAPQSRTNIFIAANETLSAVYREGASLPDLLGNHVRTQQRDLLTIKSTDPFGLAILQAWDVLPFKALPTLVEGAKAYGRPAPDHVFRAEKTAFAYESRLSELKQTPRQFHPRVVALLEDAPAIEAYCLALGAGEIAAGTPPKLAIPDFSLTLASVTADLPPIMDGALSFARQAKPDEVSRLRARYEDAAFAEKFRPWVRDNGGYQDLLRTPTPLLEDFVSLARLIVLAQLKKLMG